MKPSETKLPLEKKTLEVELNGTKKKLKCLDREWVTLGKRRFAKYVSHPVPVNGRFALGEKEMWLELMEYVKDDLKWLLRQKHHIFWSYMVFSTDAQALLVTFLQEAPPHYLRSEFPKDEDMEKALESVEQLIFLVFTRLSTRKESSVNFVEDLGKLLYDNYVITVPILLDICLIYGVSNRELVVKMLNDIVSAAPQYLNDFKEVLPHFIHVLSIVKDKFDNDQILKLKNSKVCDKSELRDVILHLHDAAANLQIFLDIYPNGSKLFRKESFAGEVSSFYTTVIPVIYNAVRNYNLDPGNIWDLMGKVVKIRLNLLSVVRNMMCGIINDVFSDQQNMCKHANDYMAKMMEVLHDELFLADYNRMYPIETDMKMLTDACQEMDMENVRYISEAVASFSLIDASSCGKVETRKEMSEAADEVKSILPHLGDGFIDACLRYYNASSERVVSAILEDQLPPELKNLDTGMTLWEPEWPKEVENNRRNVPQDTLDLLNDKKEINEMREKISHLSIVEDEYEDEYDDTYDGQDISIRGADDSERDGRPFVVPRVLRSQNDNEDSEEDTEEEEESKNENKQDWFVPNPAEVRQMLEQRRANRGRRDYVGRGRGRGQDRQVLANREYKESHKSSMGNHNRRRLASKKRNIPFLHS